MTTAPPDRVTDLARRGIRLVAAATLALGISATSSLFEARTATAAAQLVAGALLAVYGVVRERRSPEPTAIGTTALVAGVALVAFGVQTALAPSGASLDRLLLAIGSAFVGLGYLADERRLVTLGLLQWIAVLALPAANGRRFAHCVIGDEFAVPVPHLDPVLVCAAIALVVGTLHRRSGRRATAGRGFEVTGLVTLNTVLLFKAAELPGLESLCGGGDTLDEGWAVLGLVVALASALYGLAGRDSVWAATGVTALALHGLVGTALTGNALWATAAFVPLVAGMLAAERAGVRWPQGPGYGEASATARLFRDRR